MGSSGVLFGQILIVFAIIAVGMCCSTQWTAAELGYQIRLGAPWFHMQGFPVYYPWRLFEWWYAYESYAPAIFNRGGAIVASSGLVAAFTAIVGSIWRARQSKLATTYGSARWANKRERKLAGLLRDAGVFLGRVASKYLRHDGPEHVIVFGPTRSGKSGIVIPTLLTCPDSVIVHDVKRENWQLTAGWRSRFSHCLLFDPTDPRSAAYNPVLEVRKGLPEVRDAQNIADILVDPEGMLERRNHWEKTSHSLLVGSILHVLYAEEDKTLPGVAHFLSHPKRHIRQTLALMMETPHLGNRPHPVVAGAAREILNKSENEASGVLSTAMSFLGLYRDPTIAHVTRRCDWRIADLVDAEHPVSLYLGVPPSDISRTKPLMRLVLNQIGRRLTETIAFKNGIANRRRVLFLLDEFPTLGRLDFFESALAFMAGYNLRAFLIAQSLNQLEKAYGPNHAILDNCHVRVCFSSNDERTAKRISDALGTATELRNQRNYAGHRLSPWLGHLMVSRQESARPLLTPGEIMQLPPDDEIVMVSGHPPVRAKKLRYYEDQNFTSRLLPPPVLSTEDYADRPPQRPDDWAGLSPPPHAPALKSRMTDVSEFGEAGGGILHEVQLSERLAIPPLVVAAEMDALPNTARDDLSVLDDEDPTEEGGGRSARQRQFSRVARFAALDPADGIPL
jgi:type IV secretion system protein VirD4